ncbi:MAG: Rieske (2Fe-2S) protein [Chloroflexi bacterium]|nr:Rieske (2Fe-2S) protein [Chloroflexota bacterium]
MPEEKKQTDATPQLTRRNFLAWGGGALSILAIVEIAGASLLFLAPRSLEGEFGGVVTAGSVDNFPQGTVTEFPDGRFFLVRTEDGGFLALYRRCTHLGCAVSWEPTRNRFFCPCHASNFDFFGNVENPPAPRALDIFPVEINDGQVLVDTSRPQTRDAFAPEQLVYG